jgi:DNA-3-methyladenine glycosylase II
VRAGYGVAYGLPEAPTPKVLVGLGERFRPYRSIAAWYCWRAIEMFREAQRG